MTETNPVWLPIVRLEPRPDPVEQVLRLQWSYAEKPPRISRSQRYSLSLTEPLPEPVWRKA